MIAKSKVIKDRGGKFGGRAVKAVDLTLGEICVEKRREKARHSRSAVPSSAFAAQKNAPVVSAS